MNTQTPQRTAITTTHLSHKLFVTFFSIAPDAMRVYIVCILIFKETQMQKLRSSSPLTALFLVLMMFFVAGPMNLAQAKIISTGTAIQSARAVEAKADVSAFLARDDVKAQLTQMGISPDEAMTRAQNMSDSEAIAFSDSLKNAPAGGDALGVLVGAGLLVFFVLLITDILGFTKVFPFTKAAR